MKHLYIILEGKFTYGEKKYEKGEIFGGELLFPYQKDISLKHDLIATKGKYTAISLTKFFRLIGSAKLEVAFKKNDSVK